MECGHVGVTYRPLSGCAQSLLHSTLSKSREAIHNANLRAKTLQDYLNLIEGPPATTQAVKWNEVVLKNNSVSAEELEKWQPVLDSESIESAVKILHLSGYITQDESPSAREKDVDFTEPTTSPPGQPIPIPLWILFYLVSHKVYTPPHASGPMVSLTLSHLNRTPPKLERSLIILSMFQLARFNAVLPMQLLTSRFLQLDLAPRRRVGAHASKVYFNLLLQAIARNPVRSVQSATSTVALLKSMDSQKLQLWQQTCDELLKDRFVIVELTKWLRERAIRKGYVPELGQLKEYIKRFPGSTIEDQKNYKEVVEEVQQRSKGEGFLTTREGNETDQLSPIRFLQALVETPSQRLTKRVVSMASLPEVTEPTSLPDKEINPPPVPAFFFAPHRNFDSIPKKLQDQWRAGFMEAVKDISRFSARDLVRYFEWGVPSTSFNIQGHGHQGENALRVRPNLGLLTILIRGLLVRGERSSCDPMTRTNGSFLLAEKYFFHLRSTGFRLDSHAIAVGLEAFTRVGKPHTAFALLNEHCLVPPLPPTVVQGKKWAGNTNFKKLFRRTELSSIALSDFMVSLARIGRNDCVLWLFEHSVDLYSVYPDSRALSIFLQSARKAQKVAVGDGWDGLWSLFKRKQPQVDVGEDEEGDHDREERKTEKALRKLHAMVGSADKLMPYQHVNLGHDEALLSQVQKVFRSCVVSQAWTNGMAGKEHDRTTLSNPAHNFNSTLVKKPSELHTMGTDTQTMDSQLGKEAVNRLLSVVSPAQPFIPSADNSLLDSLAIPFPTSAKRPPRLSLADLFRNTSLDPDTTPSYPQVVLQDSHFRDYILFLGLAPQAPPIFREQWKETDKDDETRRKWIPPIYELSLVLAWQRYLRVPPSRDTLAAAIALFGEHGDNIPPLVADFRRWRGKGDRAKDEEDRLTYGWGEGGEYVRFIRWIEDWVEEVKGDVGVIVGRLGRKYGNRNGSGEGGVRTLMPDADMLTKWRRIIFRMREGRP
ncbi:hypothetical protein L218DRAFT_223679 [Marasmius fiardii PR-910]|nr:hypothetical protein L218DRAFT_223679 [Marasmius fiardii PR-910]